MDLFAGAGGLAEGFRQAGWRVLSAVDNDRHAAETFRMNFPEALFFENDITSVEPLELLRGTGVKVGELDCLLGGPPCQSFSYNNHRRSASNHRARLFRQYLRIVGSLRPRTLVMENVPGILTIGDGLVVGQIRRRLEKLGYETGIRVLFAEDYGVPQERRRVFIVATRLGWNDLLFPDGTHGPSSKPSLSANPFVHRWSPRGKRIALPLVTVWDAIGDLPSQPAAGVAVPYSKAPRTAFQQSIRKGSKAIFDHVPHRLTQATVRRIQTVPEGGSWRDIPPHLLPAGMRRARRSDHTKRYGRLSRRGLCCTLLTKCDPHWGSYIHPSQHRTITVREAARLQTFPDAFRFAPYISKQYEQIGNAVPPLLARRIGEALKKHLRSDRE